MVFNGVFRKIGKSQERRYLSLLNGLVKKILFDLFFKSKALNGDIQNHLALE